jgi:hypothetical protein
VAGLHLKANHRPKADGAQKTDRRNSLSEVESWNYRVLCPLSGRDTWQERRLCFWPNKCTPDCTELSTAREATICAATRECPRIFTSFTTLRHGPHSEPDSSSFSKTNLNIIHPPTYIFVVLVVSFFLPLPPVLPLRATCHVHLILLELIIVIILGEGHKL